MATAHSLHEITAELRRVAAQLDAVPDTYIPATDVSIDLQVLVRDETPEAERVAAVDAIAAALGTEPVTAPGSEFHRSQKPLGPHTATAYTAITRT